MKGFEIAGLRKQAKLKQAELAAALGWNDESLIDIERGRVGIDDATHEQVLAQIRELQRQKDKETVLA